MREREKVAQAKDVLHDENKEVKEMKKRRLTALLMAGVMAFGMMACGSSGEDKSSGKDAAKEEDAGKEKIPLKISHHPYLHGLPSIYAEENGLYDKFDYTIDMYAGGPVQNEAIASGAWEVGTTGIGGAVLGCPTYNMKVIGFACDDTAAVGIWVRPDSDLAKKDPDEKGVRGTAEDWKGKKILCQTGTTCHMTLVATLEHLGLTADDVEIVDTAVAQSYAAFKAGEADVVCLWSPFGYQAESDEGWVQISGAEGLGLEMPNLIVATEEAVKNRPEAVQQWLEAYLKAVEEMREDPEAAQKLYDFEEQEGITMTEEAAERDIEVRQFPTLEENKAVFETDENGNSKALEILLGFADFMIEQGKLTEADKQEMIDNGAIDGSFIANINF